MRAQICRVDRSVPFHRVLFLFDIMFRLGLEKMIFLPQQQRILFSWVCSEEPKRQLVGILLCSFVRSVAASFVLLLSSCPR